MLGDSCIPSLKEGRKTQHLIIAHREADREYAAFKAELLGYLNETKMSESSNTVKGVTYPCVVVRTLSHPFYNKLADHMYYDGRKTVTEHVMKCLTPLGLALWYMDDGTLAGEMGWRNPYLCTHNFNQAENDLMCRMVHKKFGVTFRTTKKNTKGKTYYWMRLRRKDREKFFDIIREYVPECMKRKIDPSFYESDERYHGKKITNCDECKKEMEVSTNSIAVRCDDCNMKRLREGHTEFYEKKNNPVKQNVSSVHHCFSENLEKKQYIAADYVQEKRTPIYGKAREVTQA